MKILVILLLAPTVFGQAKYRKPIEKSEASRLKEYRKLNAAAKSATIKKDSFLKDWLDDCASSGRTLQPDGYGEPWCGNKPAQPPPAQRPAQQPAQQPAAEQQVQAPAADAAPNKAGPRAPNRKAPEVEPAKEDPGKVKEDPTKPKP